MSQWEAEAAFLDIASHQELYGCAIFFCKDEGGRVVRLAVSSNGLSVYRMSERTAFFMWSSISNIQYKKKRFSINHKLNGIVSTIPFELQTTTGCVVRLTLVYIGRFSPFVLKALWTTAVEYHAFFRRKSNTVCAQHYTQVKHSNQHIFSRQHAT